MRGRARFRIALATSPAPAEFAPLLFAGDPAGAVAAAVALGYDAVEVSVRDPAAPAAADLCAAAGAAGLGVSAFATGQSYYADGLSPTSPDPAVRHALDERIRAIVDLAGPRDAVVVVGGVRGRLTGGPAERAAQYGTAVEAVRRWADHARAGGVTLAVEPVNRYETNFLNTIAEALAFVDEVGVDNVGVLADTFHMNIEEASPADALRLASSRLAYVHTADSNRRAPGEGHIDFAELAGVLREIGYHGYLGTEILPLPDDRRAAALAAASLRAL